MVVAARSATGATSRSSSVQRFQVLFFVAAAWNAGGAALGLLFLQPLSKLAWPGTTLFDDPISVQFAMMVFGLIGVLGLGYFLVALDPSRNRGLVLTAAIGKPIVLAIGIYFSWGGSFSPRVSRGGTELAARAPTPRAHAAQLGAAA